PELLWVIGDQLFASDDTPGAEERSDRMKRYISMKSPGLIQDTNQQQQIPPQVAQKMQQMTVQAQQSGSMIEALTSHVKQLTQEMEAKTAEMASRERIAAMQEETKRVLGLSKLNSEEAQTKLEQELGIIHKKLDRMHEASMLAAKHQN